MAFADALKDDLDDWLKEKYGISSWTDDTNEKKIIRPFLVAHGCGKRIQTQGKYWVDKIDEQIKNESWIHINDPKHVIFISDVRFPNEASWIHEKLGGWLVHLKKYSIVNDIEFEFNYALHPEMSGVEHPEQYFSDDWIETSIEKKIFDRAPNSEEAENDPLCYKQSDYKLELENVIERELRLNNNNITTESLIDNEYLNIEIKKCLDNCPLLKLQ